MDSLTFMKCMAKTGSAYFHLSDYEERVRDRSRAKNHNEDSILEQIDNERQVKALKQQMTPSQRTIASLIEAGVSKQRMRRLKFKK